MSLINDALKRTKQAEEMKPPPKADLELRPIDSPPASGAGGAQRILWFLVVAIAAGNLMLWLALKSRSAAEAVRARSAQETVILPESSPAPDDVVTEASAVASILISAEASEAPLTVDDPIVTEAKPGAEEPITAEASLASEAPIIAAVPEASTEPAAVEVAAVIASVPAPVEETPVDEPVQTGAEPEAVEVAQATVAEPIQSTPATVVQPAPLRLQSIIFNPRKPSAVINRHTVMTGDTLAGYRVKEIGMTQVILVKGEESRVLTLP